MGEMSDYANEQRDQLAFDTARKVHDATFKILDELDDLSGDMAGEIAKSVQDVIERELRHVL